MTYSQEYYKNNREKVLKINLRYRLSHKIQIKEKGKIYREKRKEYLKKWNKEYRLRNLEKMKQQNRDYYYKNREKKLEQEHKRYKELRKKQKMLVFQHYGRECKCCGDKNIEFMTIDHINNDGAEHRKKVGGTAHFYSWLIRNKFPEGFQTLCFNCNIAKGIYGVCPHKK